MEEKRDWFGLYYQNQNANYTDYLQNGISPKDVILQDKDSYKKNDKIVQAFTDNEGKFNNEAFDNFYNQALSSFNTFSQGDFKDTKLPEIEYDIMSAIRLPQEKTQKIDLKINKRRNPFIETEGLSTVLGTSESKLSPYEIAQSNRIWDTRTSSWMNKTPEDLGFWGTINETPIVFARYEEDVEIPDPETGRMVKHYKGEMKLDENGSPYYETLGNRAAHGKEFLSPFNVITKEGSTINKFDFLDNDGKEKSVAGTIAQTVATIAPMFIPYVGEYYTYGLVAKNSAQLGITLYKMLDGVFNPDKKDYEYGLLNTIEGKLSSLSPGVSEESKENMITFENFGNLISDVASQLYQQRLLAQIPTKLGLGNPERAAIKKTRELFGDEIADEILNTGKLSNNETLRTLMGSVPEIDKVARTAAIRNSILGKWLSSFYMSGISTMDVFNDGLDAGYDRSTAAFTAALAMAATTWMIGSTEIGQTALKGLGFDSERVIYRNAGKKLVEDLKEQVPEFLSQPVKDKKTFNLLLKKAGNIYRSASDQIAKGGVIGGAIAEGIEEMSEEAIMDLSKGFTDALTGVFGTQKEASFDFLNSNPLERYLMAGAGGAIGGAIFRVANRGSEINNKLPEDTKAHIFQLLRNGKKYELKNALEKLRTKGVAPKELSAFDPIIVNNEIQYKPAKGNGDSLNDAVIDIANNLIDQWDAIIDQEGLRFDENELLSKISLQDKRIKDLLDFEGIYQIAKDYNKIGTQIVELVRENVELRDQMDPGKGKEGINVEGAEAKIRQNEAKLAELRKQKDDMLNGLNTENYIARSLFYLGAFKDPILSTDIQTYSRSVLGKDYNSLSESEQADIRERYNKYKESFDRKFEEGYKIFQESTKKYGKDLLELAKQMPVIQGIKQYLANGSEESLLALQEDALNQFNILRNLNIEQGVPANRGLGYILNNDNVTFTDPNNQNIVNTFFQNLSLKSGEYLIPIGINSASLVGSKTKFSELNQTFIDDFLSNLAPIDQNGQETEFGKVLREIREEAQANANNPDSNMESSDLIRDRLLDYSNKISSPELRQLFTNIVTAGYNEDFSQYLNNIRVGIREVVNKYNYELSPLMKMASAKQLLADAKADNVELTKDLYKQLLDYIKPDSAFSLNDSVLNKSIALMIDPSVEEVITIDKLTPEGFESLGLTPDMLSFAEQALEDNGFNDLNELIRVTNELKGAKNWFEVSNIIIPSSISDQGKMVLVNALNNANVYDSKSSLQELVTLSDSFINENKLKNNPILDLLKKIEVEILGDDNQINIFDLLENENAQLKSAARLSEYVIQGKVRNEQLTNAIQTIDLLKSLVTSTIRSTNIDGSGYGYNTTLNRFRQQNQVDGASTDILPEIDQNIAIQVLNELTRVQNQLNFFKKLSEKNVGNKLREHKLTAIKTRQAIVKNFLDKNFTNKCPEMFEGVDNIIDNYDVEELFKSDLSDEDFTKLEDLVNKVEDKIYDNVNSLSISNKFTKQQLIGRLFQGYDYSKLVKGDYNNPSPLTETLSELDPSELFVYYHTISTIKASEYSKALKDIIDDEFKRESGKFLIPIFSQEYATRINVAMVLDPDFMNNITYVDSNKLNSIRDGHLKTVYKEYTDSYHNLVFNNGAPGVGKTNGVGRLTNKVINKLLGDQRIVLVGPKSQQAINLTNAILETNFSDKDDLTTVNGEINAEGNIASTKEELLTNIYNDYSIIASANNDFQNGVHNSKYIDWANIKEHNYQNYKLKSKYLDKSNFNNDAFKDQRIIYIDEVTHFSKFELEVLSEWARINNKILLTFGDLVQSGYHRVSDGLYMGIDVDALKVSTPTLSTSLRVSNIHKKDNLDALRTANEQIYAKDNNLSFDDLVPLHRQILGNIPSLKYYQENGILNGEKLAASTSIEEIENLYSNTNGDIGYIYDDTNSSTYKLITEYNRTHDKKVKTFKLNEVQGLEAPYFIVDLHLDFKQDALIEKNIRDLYTAITRSKDGTIIIDNNLSSQTFTKGSEKLNYTQESVLSSESAKSFSELRLKSLESILQNYIAPETITPQEPKSKTTTSDTKTGNVTLDRVIDEVFGQDEEKSNRVTEELYRSDSKVREYPEDSFIAYSYDNRIKEFPIKDKDGNILSYSIKSDITSSGLYDSDHTAFFNGSYSKLSPDNFKKVDRTVQSIKSVLYSFKSKERRNQELDLIESDVNNTFRDVVGNTGSLDLKNGKFQLKAVKYFYDGEIHSDGSNRSERLRVVYTIPILNSSTSQQNIELSIYSLPNGNETKFEKSKWFASYKPFYSEIMNRVPSDYSKLYTSEYIPLSDDFELEKITNLVIYKKDPEGRKHYNFEDRGTQFKGIYFSNPYVVVDYNSNKTKRNSDIQEASDRIIEAQNDYNRTRERYNSTEDLTERTKIGRELQDKLLKLTYETKKYNLKGKAIVFATYAEKIYDEDGNVIPESEYGDYYIRQASGEFDNNPDMRDKIRMIVLSPNPLTFREFFNNYDKYVKSYSQSSTSKLGNKFYKSYFGDYTGFDIILSILNYKNWLEAYGQTGNKFYKIADRLYSGLSALASTNNQQLTNIKTPNATEFHIMRIMERMHQELDSKLLDQYKSSAEKINGNDVLRYFREIINDKIKEEQGKYTSNLIENKENETFFLNLDKDITSENLFDFMEAALTGKVQGKDMPNYNPIFKEGIYPFPVMMYDKDQQGHTGDKNFIRAVNLEGSYYIDRDLQTPQFAFVASRDLANPEEFGYKKVEKPQNISQPESQTINNSEPSIKPETEQKTQIQSKNVKQALDYLTWVSNRISNPVVKSEFDKIIPSMLPAIEANVDGPVNIKTFVDNLVSKYIPQLNSIIPGLNISHGSDSIVSHIKYVGGEFTIFTQPKPIENIEDNIRKSDENRLYLQNNFGSMFSASEISAIDLATLADNFKLIESNIGDLKLINDLVINGRIDSNILNILSNENVKSALIDINKIRSKYNIC